MSSLGTIYSTAKALKKEVDKSRASKDSKKPKKKSPPKKDKPKNKNKAKSVVHAKVRNKERLERALKGDFGEKERKEMKGRR